MEAKHLSSFRFPNWTKKTENGSVRHTSMFKRLQRINGPTALLWFYIFALASLSILSTCDANRTTADLIAQLAFPLVLSIWVLADAHKRGRKLCYDYGTFVFFAWPVIVPVYLFKTRGIRALITFVCFAGICALGILFGFALSFLQESFLQ